MGEPARGGRDRARRARFCHIPPFSAPPTPCAGPLKTQSAEPPLASELFVHALYLNVHAGTEWSRFLETLPFGARVEGAAVPSPAALYDTWRAILKAVPGEAFAVELLLFCTQVLCANFADHAGFDAAWPLTSAPEALTKSWYHKMKGARGKIVWRTASTACITALYEFLKPADNRALVEACGA